MATITINTINGTPPYTIYVCNTFLLNCVLVLSGVTSTPVTFETPSAYTYSPSVVIKIIDSLLCEHVQIDSCISQTPTPSFTITPTYTPSNTSTPPVTPSNTQTSYTPTPTPTNTTTQTMTPTPTQTPQTGYSFNSPFLIIEPLSASTILGDYMQSQGVNFFGFSNGVAPSTNQVDFENEMNVYLNYSGWTSGELPPIIPLSYPYYKIIDSSVKLTYLDSLTDTFNNPLSPNNFITVRITNLNFSGEAWYSFFISSGVTGTLYQKSIDISSSSQNVFEKVNTNPTYYSIDFTHKSGRIYSYGNRLYTTFPSPEFLLNNIENLYFKGSVVGT